MTGNTRKHRVQKRAWAAFGAIGLLDYAIRGDITQLWEKPLADSVPVLFLLSVWALSVGEGAAEEGADE